MVSNALGWIGSIAEWLGRLIPRLLIIPTTHGGIAFIRGKNVKPLKPGLHLYWRFWTKVLVIPTARQTKVLEPRSLTTADNKSVAVGAMLRYKIQNVEAALAKSWDIENVVADELLVALCDLVAEKKFSQLVNDRQALHLLLERAIKKHLTRPFGIEVLVAKLTDLQVCRTLRLIGIRPEEE